MAQESHKSLDMPEHLPRKDEHPRRHNFAEELGNNGPKNTA